MNIKKKIISLVPALFLICWITTASSILPWTSVNVNAGYDEHLLTKIINNYLLNPQTTGNFTKGYASDTIPFQGWINWESPLKNGCKLVQDDKSMEKYWFITATCPIWTQVIWKDLWVYTQSGSTWMSFTCDVPIKENLVSKYEPKLDIDVEWECSGWNLCKGIEPWYNVGANTSVSTQIKIKPWSGDVQIGW